MKEQVEWIIFAPLVKLKLTGKNVSLPGEAENEEKVSHLLASLIVRTVNSSKIFLAFGTATKIRLINQVYNSLRLYRVCRKERRNREGFKGPFGGKSRCPEKAPQMCQRKKYVNECKHFKTKCP